MAATELASIAKDLVAESKGILAADESHPTIAKRFSSIEVENTEENRRSYRDMLFTTPGLEEFISGVILFDETIHQSSADGTPFSELLRKRGIIPGIKVDKGAKDLALFPGEKVTEGLDGLRDRLKEYYDLGARFTKWRAVIDIADDIPTIFGIAANTHALSRFAALSQEAGLVPIVEPEVLMDGAHSIDKCGEVTREVLKSLFQQLDLHRVPLEGLLLKTNMVISGKKNSDRVDVQEVAEKSLVVLKDTVPAEVPGIVFLSGGQSDEEATAHLDAMNKIGDFPWEISFSYGRALQAPSLAAWKGQASNVEAGQKALYQRAKLNGAARSGKYSSDMENEAA